MEFSFQYCIFDDLRRFRIRSQTKKIRRLFMRISKERKKTIVLVTVLVMVLAAVSFFGITMLVDDNTDAADIDDTMTSLE